MTQNGCGGPWPIGSINSPFSKNYFLSVAVMCKQLCVFYVKSLSCKLLQVVLCWCFLFYVAIR